jgi:hypothetical protein
MALEFRRRMTEGSLFEVPNTYRKGFYELVMSMAQKVKFRVLRVLS